MRAGDVIIFGDAKRNWFGRGLSSARQHTAVWDGKNFVSLGGVQAGTPVYRDFRHPVDGMTSRVYRHTGVDAAKAKEIAQNAVKQYGQSNAMGGDGVYTTKLYKQLGYRRILDFLGIKGTPVRGEYDASKAICSAVAAKAYEDAGHSIIPKGRHVNDIAITTPEELTRAGILTHVGNIGNPNFEKQRVYAREHSAEQWAKKFNQWYMKSRHKFGRDSLLANLIHWGDDKNRAIQFKGIDPRRGGARAAEDTQKLYPILLKAIKGIRR